ncbi:MAG: hypothetical protein ACI4I1_12825 [Oscillospiraceae bacterium]
MGMLKEMFSDNPDENYQKREPVFLAKAKYTSNAEMILSGYKTFQKKYVIKKVVLKMLLVVIAVISSVLMLLTSESGDIRPIFMILICVVIGSYFISQPIKNQKEVKKSAEQLEGTEYEIEITDQTIKITMPSAVDNEETVINEDGESTDMPEEIETEDNGVPATLIHLDGAVDIIDRDDMFIICVGKKYVFIVPQDVFSEEELENTRHKLAAIMGIRYKIDD